MPQPIPNLSCDQQCHHYQTPTGERCGSPAMKSEYYCYFHNVKHVTKKQSRVLIDPELTRLELPPIEDRASIAVALAAVIHRLAENTIDTRRAGQLLYGLEIALRALQPIAPAPTRPAAKTAPVVDSHPAAQPPTGSHQPATDNLQPATPAPDNPQPETPQTIPITKESLLYFLRSRHCANCSAELFPAHELTERRHPGAPPEVIEESRPALPSGTLPNLQAVAEQPPSTFSTVALTSQARQFAPSRRTHEIADTRLPHRCCSLRAGIRLARRAR